MKLTSYGAAQEVTGSKHLLEVNGSRILLDCGLFQGHRHEADKKNRQLPFDPKSIDAVVLSHAHIDHSGLLPLLGKEGFSGRVFSTPGTRDLCAVMLVDSASIQERDAEWLSRKKKKFVKPLYEQRDAYRIMRRFITIPYCEPIDVAPGVRITFHNAGHILGSAMVLIEAEEDGEHKTLLFSGDLGRKDLPILNDPAPPDAADYVLMESTYGNREHESFATMEEELRDIVNATHARGGKIIIPSFALERAQEVVYALKLLEVDGAIPTIPVYVDSPMTVNVTEVFRLHYESFDEDFAKVLEENGDPFQLNHIEYIRDVRRSIALNDKTDPCIIISASGMCETGRILHHIKNNCTDPKNTILIVGFQAQHTLGRRIVEKQPTIRIFGEDYPLRAQVEVLDAFSCHAGRSELVDFAARFSESARKVFLVHGETDAMGALTAALEERGLKNVATSKFAETYTL